MMCTSPPHALIGTPARLLARRLLAPPVWRWPLLRFLHPHDALAEGVEQLGQLRIAGTVRAVKNGAAVVESVRAIAVMSEAGVDISGQESTILSDEMLARADVVVTVCGHADELCPALPSGIRKIHWPLADPAKSTGAEDVITDELRATREEVERRVGILLKRLSEGADR